jgi:hypothetical protein
MDTALVPDSIDGMEGNDMRNVDPEALREAQKALKVCNAVRRFPVNTCPASRHVQLAAQGLIRDGHHPAFQEEPLHIASSMLAVVTELYKARTRIAELEGDDRGHKAKPGDKEGASA